MTLGQRIQEIRITHSMTQEEFGEKLGTTRQTVSRWELDQTYPELSKIVLISKLFSVSTDSILINGISTFDADFDVFSCGVYRSSSSEIVETEKFALEYYSSDSDKNIFGTKLYFGFENKKYLVAICERDHTLKSTKYAYFTEDKQVICNSDVFSGMLGKEYYNDKKTRMRRLEKFFVDHSGEELPKVSEAGIPKCLNSWRRGASYLASAEHMHFTLFTQKTEYVFYIDVKDTNIYCGISYNTVFDLGLFSGMQFFRIRNYKDNSEPFCNFFYDFGYDGYSVPIPTHECKLGEVINTDNGIMFCVKRYNDDEIILAGCGDEEYTYKRCDTDRTERFIVDLR